MLYCLRRYVVCLLANSTFCKFFMCYIWYNVRDFWYILSTHSDGIHELNEANFHLSHVLVAKIVSTQPYIFFIQCYRRKKMLKTRTHFDYFLASLSDSRLIIWPRLFGCEWSIFQLHKHRQVRLVLSCVANCVCKHLGRTYRHMRFTCA